MFCFIDSLYNSPVTGYLYPIVTRVLMFYQNNEDMWFTSLYNSPVTGYLYPIAIRVLMFYQNNENIWFTLF